PRTLDWSAIPMLPVPGSAYYSGGAPRRTLRLGRCRQFAYHPEGGVDDGHEEESRAPGAEAGTAQARSTPAARIAAAALHRRVVHGERPPKERRLVSGRARLLPGGAVGDE